MILLHPIRGMSLFAYLLVYGVCLGYLIYLIKLAKRKKLNLIDLFFHGLICVIPPFYMTFFYEISEILSRLGIRTSFLVLFGSFLVVLFLYISRLAVLLHAAEKKQMRLSEELALAVHEIDKLKKQ